MECTGCRPDEEVVTVTDDALFGQDGTQPPPPPPLLADPLGGLVTGFLFADTTVAAPDETHWQQEAVPEYVVAARRIRPVATTARANSGAFTPAQFEVAAPLSSRPVQQRRATVPRTEPVAPAPSARANRRQTIGAAQPVRRPKRSGGAGCAVVVVLVVAVVVVFVLLGLLLGHGDASVTSGGGG
jgi:hypothetical protein